MAVSLQQKDCEVSMNFLRFMKFLSPEFVLYFISCLYVIYVVISVLVFLVATSNYKISYKSGYVGMLELPLLPLLNLWLIVEMQPAKVFSIGITLVDVHMNWLNWFHFLILEGVLPLILIDSVIFLYHYYVLKGCLCQHFFSQHRWTLEFSAYRILSFDL